MRGLGILPLLIPLIGVGASVGAGLLQSKLSEPDQKALAQARALSLEENLRRARAQRQAILTGAVLLGGALVVAAAYRRPRRRRR